MHPDFNTHAIGHRVTFSGKKVSPSRSPPRPKVLVRLRLNENVLSLQVRFRANQSHFHERPFNGDLF